MFGVLKNGAEEHVSMSAYTSFRAGGPARYLLKPTGVDELELMVKTLNAGEVPFVVMGRGTNILVRDGGYRGAIILLSDEFRFININHCLVNAGGSTPLPLLAREAADKGLSGLEFATGIPGSLGGALVMNAGAFGGTLEKLVRRVQVVTPGGHRKWLSGEDIAFNYRSSNLKTGRMIVVEGELVLQPGVPETIKDQMKHFNQQRLKSQPRQPSAGSVFRNPSAVSAGELIDRAGCKGLKVGDAEVSSLHANFIVNTGRATATEIVALMEEVRDIVERKFRIKLELEIDVIGDSR